jgi:hypothetical protein
MFNPDPNRKCEVCGIRFPLKHPDTGLAVTCSSTIGAWSFAKCHVCLVYGVEPLWLVEATLAVVGGVENVMDDFRDYPTFYDGKYVTVGEYLTSKH